MSWLQRFLQAFPSRDDDEDATPHGDPQRVAAVERVLDRHRPWIAADGGRVRLVAVESDGWVELHMAGACRSCHASTHTLRGALEPELRSALPWIQGVREV